MWRWDQGRLSYFSLEKIRKIASVIVELDGVDLTSDPDPIRNLLEHVVGLPFAPANYRVWRNYARVFKVLGLASKINNQLIATEACKSLVKTGNEFITYDDYIHFLIKIFYYPSPIFQGYNTDSNQEFPFCSLLKYLVSKIHKTGDPSISVEEVFNTLIGNNVTGLEDISFYSSLRKTNVTPVGDQSRQVREMLIFVSQLSYLSWIDGKLFIDPSFVNALSTDELLSVITPIMNARNIDPELEIQNMFSPINNIDYVPSFKEPSEIEDIVFTEGKKIRVSHLRTERNRKVVSYYFENTKNTALCNVCEVEVRERYPWVSNLIEVHHILPLASPLQVERSGTSMDDLVGLCPNCHRATHAFYRSYLAENNMTDFQSNDHAKEVYGMVKSTYVSI